MRSEIAPNERRVAGDWFPGTIPANVSVGAGACLETTYSLRRFFSERQPGLLLGDHCGVYAHTVFAVGSSGQVSIGEYSILNGVYLRCEREINIGRRVLISWNVGIFDTYELPRDGAARGDCLAAAASHPQGRFPSARPDVPVRPVVLEDDTWIGFGSVLSPGVRIGAGSVVGACSVVTEDVPPGMIAAGNPARVVRPVRPVQPGDVAATGSEQQHAT